MENYLDNLTRLHRAKFCTKINSGGGESFATNVARRNVTNPVKVAAGFRLRA